jgi:hypothetical protein
MEIQEEVAQLEALKKQTLQKLIAVGSQYNNIWTECLETSQQVQVICERQRQRAQEGFSPSNHPNNKPGFHSKNQNVQFEDRQRFEKQSFEHQNDEQTKNALNQQWNQSRQRAQARLEMIDELHSVFATLSE